MLRRTYDKLLSATQRARVKYAYYAAQKTLVDRFFAYDREQLKKALLQLGISQGDTLFVHSSFRTVNGFQGSPQDVIDCLIEILGEEGNLLMPSMQYRSSSYEHLQGNELFDVRKTFSKMGLITEVFRRKKGVLRSIHPTHSVLAWGKEAARIVEGHDKCLYPCGRQTPFDKFRSLNGKVLFFDVPFNTFTFIHYIEDLIKSELPFPLYRKEPIPVDILDAEGRKITVSTYVFSEDAVSRRRPAVLKRHLLKKNMIRKEKIGRTALMLVSAEDAVRCAQEMLSQNVFFYEGAAVHA
jgi:aminoglycoside 3-N-acetyltransferase